MASFYQVVSSWKSKIISTTLTACSKPGQSQASITSFGPCNCYNEWFIFSHVWRRFISCHILEELCPIKLPVISSIIIGIHSHRCSLIPTYCQKLFFQSTSPSSGEDIPSCLHQTYITKLDKTTFHFPRKVMRFMSISSQLHKNRFTSSHTHFQFCTPLKHYLKLELLRLPRRISTVHALPCF